MSRNRKRIDFYNNLLRKNKSDPIIKDKDDRDAIQDVLIEKSRDFQKINVIAKAKDLKKDNVLVNRNFHQMYNGFLNTKDKEKYIWANRNYFKLLNPKEQEKLLKLYLDFIE